MAEMIEIVGILVAGGDRQNAREQDVRQWMRQARRIARIMDRRRQLPGNAQPPRGLRQQQDTTVRTDPPAIESSANLLAANGWQGEGQMAIVSHGGRGSIRLAFENGFDTYFLRHFRPLGYARQPKGGRPVNKAG